MFGGRVGRRRGQPRLAAALASRRSAAPGLGGSYTARSAWCCPSPDVSGTCRGVPRASPSRADRRLRRPSRIDRPMLIRNRPSASAFARPPHPRQRPRSSCPKQGPAGEPPRVADQPGDRAGRHRGGEERRLTPPENQEDRDEHRAAGNDEERRRRTHRQIEHQGAGRDQGGCGIGPSPTQGDGAFERDQRAKKPAHHQRAVRDQPVWKRQRQTPAEAHQSEPRSAGHRHHAGCHERHAPAEDCPPPCFLATRTGCGPMLVLPATRAACGHHHRSPLSR
jgi:hypothetical protein